MNHHRDADEPLKERNNVKIKFLTYAVFAMVAAAGPSLAAPGMVYVADEGSNTVSVLDAESFKILATIAVGREPHNVQLSLDGKLAWVTTNGEVRKAEPTTKSKTKGMSKDEHAAMTAPGEVWGIDTASRTVVAKVPVGMHPAHVVLSSDGRIAVHGSKNRFRGGLSGRRKILDLSASPLRP